MFVARNVILIIRDKLSFVKDNIITVTRWMLIKSDRNRTTIVFVTSLKCNASAIFNHNFLQCLNQLGAASCNVKFSTKHIC